MKTRTGYRTPARNRRTAPWNPQSSAVASGPSLAAFTIFGGVITLVFNEVVSLGPELPELYYRAGPDYDGDYIRIPLTGAVQNGPNQVELVTPPSFVFPPAGGIISVFPGVDGIRDSSGGTAWGAAVGAE